MVRPQWTDHACVQSQETEAQRDEGMLSDPPDLRGPYEMEVQVRRLQPCSLPSASLLPGGFASSGSELQKNRWERHRGQCRGCGV